MANEKQPLAEKRLIAILKDFRKEMRLDFQETLAQYHEEEVFPRFEEIKREITKLSEKVGKIEQEIKWIRRDIKDLTAEFSTSVSMKDFVGLRAKILTLEEELNELKAKVGLSN